MSLSPDEVAGLGVALNEAAWLGAEVDEDNRLAGVTLSPLTLPSERPAPKDRGVQILLKPVGRVVAVHTSSAGEVLPLQLKDLLPAVQRFGGRPIYGWEFIDIPFVEPSEKSCDVTLGVGGLSHMLHLFQEGGERGSLQIWLWFDDLALRTPAGESIALEEFIAGGRRWWDGLYGGDPRTSAAGIFPLKGGAAALAADLGVRRTPGGTMPDFACPRCGGSQASRWALPNPLLVHWVLNPGIVINEVLLGQRIPRETYFCETCTGPKPQRAYVGCPHCGAWHPAALWSQRRAFGHWLGYVCPDCGKGIPCLWNVISLFLVAVTAPFWWVPLRIYGPQWRSWQRERIRGVTPPNVAAAVQRIKWVRMGILFWGLPVGLLFSLVMAFFVPGRSYGENLRLLLLFLPMWVIGGVGFGLAMKWIATKWGTS